MTFRIKLNKEGKDVFHGVLPNIEKAFERGIRAGLEQAGFNLVKTAKDGIQRQKKTGKVVINRKNRRQKRASAAGQYPSNEFGETIKSIDYEVRGSSQMEFGIRDRKKDGPKNLPTFLEEGTRSMKARPTLALSHAAREGDTYNYLRRMPFDEIVKKRR